MVALASVTFLVACQKTPESEVIINKSDNTLDEKLQSSAQPSNAYSVPEKWVEEYRFGNVICDIDATINVPAVSEYAVFKVEKTTFRRQILESLLTNYANNAASAYKTRDTVDELKEELEAVVKGEVVENSDGSVSYEAYEGQEEDIAELQRKIKDAESQWEELSLNEVNTDDLPFIYTYVLKDGTRLSIRMSESRLYATTYRKCALQSESEVETGYTRPNEPVGTTIGDVTISQEHAVNLAMQVPDNLGARNLGVAKVEKGRVLQRYTSDIISSGWIVTFMRNDGNSIPYDVISDTVVGLLQYEPSEYAPPWTPERMIVYVDETGVRSIEWTNPIAVVLTLNDNVELLPFEQIQENARNLIKYGLSWLGEEKNIEINIKNITLTNALCAIKDSMDFGMLIPTWVIEYENTDSNGTSLTTIIAINAVDGSRVDPLQLVAVAPSS